MYDSFITNQDGCNRYSYSLSLVRFIALILIIICHMMQYEGCVLAWWFNIGV